MNSDGRFTECVCVIAELTAEEPILPTQVHRNHPDMTVL